MRPHPASNLNSFTNNTPNTFIGRQRSMSEEHPNSKETLESKDIEIQIYDEDKSKESSNNYSDDLFSFELQLEDQIQNKD